MNIARFIEYDEDGNRTRPAATEAPVVEAPAELSKSSLKADLVAAAEDAGIEGADGMTKDELVDALGL